MKNARPLALQETPEAAHAAARARMLSEFEADTDAELIYLMSRELERVRAVARHHLAGWRRLASLLGRNGYEIASALPPRRRGRRVG